MLRNVKDLRGYAIRATDGVIGKVDDFYFDDEDWGIRYLVVDTGSWLSRRKVLISPIAVGHAGWMARRLPVALTRTQVEHSPDIDTRKPVSRQHEAEYFRYYGYPYYWGGGGLWGMGAYPGGLTTENRIEEELKVHRARTAGRRMIATCAAATRSLAIISRRRMVTSATWKICSLTITRGRLPTWLSPRATGGAVSACSSRRSGSRTSVGRRPTLCRSDSAGRQRRVSV